MILKENQNQAKIFILSKKGFDKKYRQMFLKKEKRLLKKEKTCLKQKIKIYPKKHFKMFLKSEKNN